MIASDRSHVTKQSITIRLGQLGLREGDTILVHSSLSRFGHVDGGADAVIDALLETLGPEGTLMMSAITTNVQFVTACIAATDKSEMASVEPFDVAFQKTYAGTIAETFRTRPGVKRSWHPTHSVAACGARADEMITDHENAAGPCGEGTPYTRVCELDRGFILLLGVSHHANTTLHGMEELAQVDYVLYPKPARIPIRTVEGIRESFTRVHNAFMGRNLCVFETDYIDGMAETVTHIGDSHVRFVNARKMREITMAALKRDTLKMLSERGIKAFRMMRDTGVYTRDPFEASPTQNCK